MPPLGHQGPEGGQEVGLAEGCRRHCGGQVPCVKHRVAAPRLRQEVQGPTTLEPKVQAVLYEVGSFPTRGLEVTRILSAGRLWLMFSKYR